LYWLLRSVSQCNGRYCAVQGVISINDSKWSFRWYVITRSKLQSVWEVAVFSSSCWYCNYK
jgi:hypothetical protein